MEKLLLATGKEYTLAVGGFTESEGAVRIKIVSEESLEQIKASFSSPEATNTMKVVNGAVTQIIIEGFTEMGSTFTISENEIVDTLLNGAEPEAVYGSTAEFSLRKRPLEKVVEKNRADIDYLMMMEGELI